MPYYTRILKDQFLSFEFCEATEQPFDSVDIRKMTHTADGYFVNVNAVDSRYSNIL